MDKLLFLYYFNYFSFGCSTFLHLKKCLVYLELEEQSI